MREALKVVHVVLSPLNNFKSFPHVHINFSEFLFFYYSSALFVNIKCIFVMYLLEFHIVPAKTGIQILVELHYAFTQYFMYFTI